MKKILLFFVIALLVGCAKDYTSDFNAIDERLDKLEQSLPSIEEQIESINAQLKSLKATYEAIKEQISELEKSDEATTAEIADLKRKDSALEKSISDLQNYVDTQIANAKSEAAAAYATVEQYNTIVAQLNALQSSTNKLGEELTAKINAEVKSLTDKIAELEARLKAVEDKVENLLARIQSVSYIPEYADGKVVFTRMGSTSWGELSFRISPKDAVVELEKVWSEALSCEAYYPKTRAVSLVKLAVTEYVADAEIGVITVKVSGEGLSEEFFVGTQEASVALVISDGNNSVTSEYIPMVAKEITDEIWYTTTDNQPLTPNHEGVDIFGANIVSNSYNEESGWFVLKFDAPVTKIGEKAFGAGSENDPKSTLQSIILPNGVQSIDFHAFSYCCDELLSVYMPDTVSEIGRTAFANNDKLEYVRMSKNLTTMGVYAFSKCSSLKNINLPESLTAIPDYCFRYCSSLASITIPDSVTSIGESAFRECDALESIEIPSSVEVLSPQIFTRCNKLKDVILNEGLKTISYHCFMLCKSLDTIIIPNSVEIIESGVFDYAIVQKFAGKFTTEDGVCLIVDGVLKKVADSIPEYYTLPSTITTLGKGCFSSITPVKDTHITIPDSVTEFEVRAFGQTYNIAGFYGKYATEDHVAVIKDNILYGVAGRALPDKYFVPEGVVKIAEYAFDTVKYVSEIVLPSTIIEIETATLKVGETGRMLTALYCKALVPPVIGEKIFNDLVPEKFPTIYVPMQSRDAYLAADGWKEFADKIVGYNF